MGAVTGALVGRVAIVTGSSRGIGAAIAVRLAAEGAAVVVTYSENRGAADGVASAITHAGGSALVAKVDVAQPSECEMLVATCLETYGAIDILVNNAGITRDGLIVRMSDDDWAAVLATNLTGAFTLVRAAARPMMKARSGVVINVSSVVGITGNPGQANYAAAKAGLIGLTRAAARELAPRNIRVNAVAPGFIETDMTAALPERVRETALASVALKRFGSSEDVAAAVAFLASDEARYITGQTLVVDGGMTFT